MQRNIQADHISQFDRSHRHTEAYGGAVNDFRRYAGLEREQSLVDVWRENAIHHESGRTLAGTRQLIELAGKLEGVGHDLWPGACPLHHFHELQLRYGIEEVNAD